MSFFDELKRRNVFRVGIAYAVGAWLLLQLTEVLSELLKLPEQFGPIVVAVVAIGFPVVLFFAWAYEMTPQGIMREKDIDRSQSITHETGRKLDRAIIGLLAVALAYFIWEARFADRSAPAESSPGSELAAPVSESLAPVASAQPAIDPHSIAVLPFTNRSRLEEDEFFVEGVHDDLLTNLARIGGLKVISRTSVLRYAGTEKPIPVIAEELGVATVMEGAVQRAGNTVRINVQLIDAATDEHLWAEIFDRELTAENLFAIQTEISEKIAGALHTTLSPQDQRTITARPTANMAAYDAYLRGRQLMARRDSEDLQQALVEFKRAAELDPEFALAWVGIAETSQLLFAFSTMPLPEALKASETAAQRALEINDRLGEAWLSLAEVDYFHERLEAAEAKYRKAIELSPGYVPAYVDFSDFLDDSPQRRAEALAILRKAEQLDPLSPTVQLEIADQLILLGRFDAAEGQLRRLIELEPEFAPAYQGMANLMQTTGRFNEQVVWLRKALALDPGRISLYVPISFAMLNLGDDAALEGIRNEMARIDAEHWSVGWVETLGSLYRKNFAAALESGTWVHRELGNLPDFNGVFGWVHLFNGDYEKARESFRIAAPEFFERSTWRQAIELNPDGGCIMAYIMRLTGDEEAGRRLLQMTLAYLENELPNYVAHADRYGFEFCYMVSGDHEAALDALETSVAHGHYGGWWLMSRLSLFDPLRGDPRFEAVEQQLSDMATRQRASLAQWEAQGP
ncbi:MAG: tetratricopeptide repeat protein [Xanthomonadales bacterium]|nr:tetratricopeptide repeat protein [Xanthomonadales bacterium]NIX12134.1 tetratricopeptide repeat protein [Xanthomonadales bacterium]